MRKKPKILQQRVVAQSRLFQLEALDLEFSNGEKREYERLVNRRRGAVIIIPMLDDDQCLLVREYAAGTDRYELGLPKGLIDEGEDPITAANRELQEEVGYASKQLTHLQSFTLAPGYFSSTTEVILAQDLYPSRLPGDEPEEIEVVPCRLSTLSTLFAEQQITEARSIAALFLARDLLQGKKNA